MIVSETKPFGIIRVYLKKSDKISIVSCNNCARMCGTGGKEGLREMKKKLEENGYKAVDDFVFSPVCDRDLDKKVIKPKGNVILMLACEAGLRNVERLFKSKRVVSALDTIGLGSFDEKGDIFLIREFK